MSSDKKLLDTLLLVFARTLKHEMITNGYWKEWSSVPLEELVTDFFTLLDYHPNRLGMLIGEAYDMQTGSRERDIERSFSMLGTNYPELFGNTKQSYLDQYTASTIHYDVKRDGEPFYSTEQRELLENIAHQVVHAFALLGPRQERPQRTLETVTHQLARFYYLDPELRNIGFDLDEYKDYWRGLAKADRMKLKETVLN